MRFVVAATVFLAASPSIAGECLTYGAPVTLTGTVSVRIFANLPSGPETAQILNLRAPICVDAGADEFDLAASDVRSIQLACPKHRLVQNQSVTLTGSLWGEQTQHHHTPVLLSCD